MSFGERLRDARKASGLTLEALAERIGSSKAYIWQLENKSNARPSAELLTKLCDVLKVEPTQLLTGEASSELNSMEKDVLYRRYGALSERDRRVVLDLMSSFLKTDDDKTKGSS